MENTADKAIITVVGKDTVGIIAKVCTYLSENKINDRRYEAGNKGIYGVPEGFRCDRRADRRIHQVPERRDFREDAQNLTGRV